MREKGARPLRDAARMFKRMPCAARILLGAFLLAALLYGGAKPGGGMGPRGNGGNPPEPASGARPLTAEDFARGFVMTRVGTGEAFDFSAPSNAVISSEWRVRGASDDWMNIVLTNRSFRIGTNGIEQLRVFSSGRIEPPVREADGTSSTNRWFAPFTASLGIVPQANWAFIAGNENATAPEDFAPSQFWHDFTPSNTLRITWRNALLDRETNAPVSFQMELWPFGRFVYRYDLARIDTEIVSNIFAGASFGGNAWITNALPTNVTSMAFYPLSANDAGNQDPDGDGLPTNEELFYYDTDPNIADTDYDGLSDYEELFVYGTDPLNPYSAGSVYSDGLAVKLGGTDPFSTPPGSTNTVLEHIFYSGTTNGVFVYPQSSDSAAVLEVSVSGSGAGDLIVGNRVVPLVVPPQQRSAPPNPMPPFLVQLVKGQTYPLYLRGDELLQVSLGSSDFAFGVLPTHNASGHINFPNTVATEPCIHDFNSRRRGVSLPMSDDAGLLTCVWQGSDDVGVTNHPPRGATITGNFSARSTRGVTYTLSHPQYLFGQTTYSQTVRFCPRPPDPDPEDPDPVPDPPWYSAGEGAASTGNEGGFGDDWCCYWGTCGEWCGCGCDCGGSSGGNNDPGPDAEFDENCPDHSVPYTSCAHFHEDDYTNALQNVQHLGGVLYIREPPFYEQIHLDVPTEHRNCCPCPDHWTNYVGVAYKSYRLRLLDANGADFSRAETSCDVNLAGIHPSSSVGDATLVFTRNGEIYRQYDKTVLGVAIKGSGADLAACNALNSVFGYPITVCTNVLHAQVMKLVTNVRLPAGNIHLELAGATAQFTVWYYHRGDGTYHKLLDTVTCPVKNLGIPYWKELMRRTTFGDTPELPIYITSPTPGSVELKFRYWTLIDGKFVQDEATQKITSIKPVLLPDENCDGNINDEDVALFLTGRKFRFWENEDVIKGSYSGQISGSNLNADDSVINGAYDLVNFFPMAVNFSPLVNAWGNQVRYRIEPEWQESNSFNFCWANIGRTGYRRMQSESVTDINGTPIENAALTNLPYEGCDIPYSVMEAISGESGMILSEARSSNVTMRFTVKNGDKVIFTFVAPLSITQVKDMYRWINIRNVAGDSRGENSSLYSPSNNPDSECDNRHFVFVHGYNVNPFQARDWANSVFKRLWWSGSRSMFTAVDWYGDDSQFAEWKSPNYYINVEHALMSAPALASQCAQLQGAKTFIAHSLGNMVVSSAAKEYHLSYAKYYMVNAAVAMECYQAEMTTSNMVEHGWRDVPERLWSSNWHQLFASADGRSDLRWSLRFSNLTNLVNCYSPSEDVLGNATYNGVGGVWTAQELFKGTAAMHAVPGNCEGGWGYNGERTNWLGLLPDEVKTNSYTDVQLIESPIFRPFDNASLHATNIVTLTLAEKARVLGDGIPALSFAAGANPISNNIDIVNVNMTGYEQDWPRRQGEWRHSDMVRVAYRFLSRFYRMIVNGTEGETE